jgi:site-specific DNA-methyltransferase (adenine-specific)
MEDLMTIARSLFESGRRIDFAPFAANGSLKPMFTTRLGALFKGDCLAILGRIRDECIDTVFADPPFNIGKEYGQSVNDRREDHEYNAFAF